MTDEPSEPEPAPDWNLHELAREVVDPMRAAFPDRLLDLEHRGDAHGTWGRDAITAALEALARHAFESTRDGDSLWMRSSATGDGGARIDLEWHGPPLPAATAAALETALSASIRDARLEMRNEHDAVRAALVFPRSS